MVKISNIRLIDLASNEEDAQLIEQFNDTAALYPKDQTIHSLFEKQAQLYPDAVAVVDRQRSVSYRELSEASNQMAAFLQSKGVQEESVVGLLLNNSADTLVAMLGVLKAGGAYLPIDPAIPYERISFLVQDTQTTVVLSEKKFLKTLNRLQWDCPKLTHYLCLDTDQVYAEKEVPNELMTEGLWDYIGETAHDAISGGAWFSSYTGQDLTQQDMDEYADNILEKLRPYLTPQTRVLEIGCSSGISMCRIAPHVGYYLGTDLSSKILETTARDVAAKCLTNIQLQHLPAHAIDQLEEKDFDIVILNSVVQCFDGHHYLRDVLQKALGRMKTTGLIFLGDIQDNDRKAELLTDLETFSQTHSGQGQKTKTDWSNELFLSQQFFNELPAELPAICSVDHSTKLGTADNELTRFRYDTLLTIDQNTPVSEPVQKTKFQWGINELACFSATPIAAGKPSGLAYIIYTSGSTGQPKGCLVTHENVVRLMHNNRHPFDFTAADVWIMAHAYNFDFSVWEIYGALLYGGKLIVPSREEVKDVKRLLELVQTHHITVFNQTPLAFYYFIEQALAQPENCLHEHLRYVIFGGDRLDYGKLKPWVETYPLDKIRLINMYGITETTVHVTYYAVQSEDISTHNERSLIGKPLPETTVYILNEQKNIVPPGMVGELYVGGTGVCRGYLNRNDLTQERFISNPFKPSDRLYRTGDRGRWLPTGEIEFLGRVDDQVKIRGFRIEPKEIEVKLRKHAGIQDVCVYACEEAGSDEKYLEAAITLSEETQYTLKHLLEYPLSAGATLDIWKQTLTLPNGMVVFHRNRQETNHLFQEIFAHHGYLKNGIAIRANDVIVDVGANIGMFALYAGLRVPSAQIYAFEPLPPIFDLLKANLALYPIQAEVFPVGLSGTPETVDFTYYPHNTVMSGRYGSTEADKDTMRQFLQYKMQEAGTEWQQESLQTEQLEEVLSQSAQSETYTCQLMRLSDFIRDHALTRIDLLKIDVEKSEKDVMEGIDEADWAKIRQVVVEVQDVDGRLAQMTNLLQTHGFQCIIEQEEELLQTNIYTVYAVQPSLLSPAKDQPNPQSAQVYNGKEISGNVFLKEVQAFAAQELPAYMVPASFKIVTHIPLTSNGKTDKKALLKLPNLNQQTQTLSIAPRTEGEKQVAAVWEEVLGKKEISVTDNFFEIGGHSLKATRVLSHLHANLHKKITLGAFFENPTIEKLAVVLEHTSQNHYTLAAPLAPQDYYEVSHAQQRLWILSQMEGGSTAYNIPITLLLEGSLDVASFTRAFQALIERHESLRTTFTTQNGQLKQVIHTPAEVAFEVDVADWSEVTASENAIRQWLTHEAQTVFDLEHGPLVRVGLRKLTADTYLLAVTMHHIISDAWSLSILVHELVEVYRAFRNGQPNPLLPLRIHYKEYAARQHQQLSGDALATHQTYWHHQLQGEIPVLDLPADFSRPLVKTFHGNSLIYTFDADIVQQLEVVAQQEGSSLFMVLLAAVKVLLYRYTGQSDILVGTSIAGRDSKELENQVGFYINMLTLRSFVDAEKPFADFLQAVKTTTLGAYTHQMYPFDRLVDDLHLTRDPSRSPLFDVVVELINVSSDATSTDDPEGFQVQPYPSDYQISKFDLTFRFTEQPGGLSLTLEYNTDLYRPERIETIWKHLNQLLLSIREDYQRPVYALPFYDTSELKTAYTDLFVAPASVENTMDTVLDLWDLQVKNNPQAVAIRAGNKTYTYQETDTAAAAMANYLRTQGNIQPEAIVGILGYRSPQFIIGLLGILKAGAAFLPLDPQQPADRIQYMLSEVDVQVVLLDLAASPPPPPEEGELDPPQITYLLLPEMDNMAFLASPQPPSLPLAPSWGGGILSQAAELSFGSPVEEPWSNSPSSGGDPNESLGASLWGGGEAACYLIYTSGSTGKPKAVGVTHSNLYHYISWANEAYFQNQTGHVFGLFTSLSFDLTITSIFSTLTRGDELVILDEKPIDELLSEQFSEESLVNTVKMTPSHVSLLGRLPLTKTNVSTIILGGEAVKPIHIQVLQRLNPEMKIYNEYGPTETTVGCAIKDLTNAEELITIGKPITGVHMLILDEHLQLLPPYLSGEVCIAGPTVSLGYLNNAEQTAQKFIENPYVSGQRMYRSGDRGYLLPNGEIVLKGRTDEQVKIRGNRIELGEIASCLTAHPQVQDAYVTTIGTDEDKQLVAFVAATDLTDSLLRTYLTQQLPQYMVPASITVLEALPLNANGKTDRQALLNSAVYQPTAVAYVAPRTPLEETLVTIWEDVLEHNPIGVHDNFFTLGGHSLRAILLISRIQQELDIPADMGSLFSHPTIAGLAEILADTKGLTLTYIEPLPVQDSYEVSHAQRRLWVLNQLEDDLTAYHIPTAVHFDGTFDNQAFEKALQTVVERHESLRTFFVTIDGHPRQRIATPTDITSAFAYTDLRTSPDRDAQAEQLMYEMATLSFDLSRPPLFRTHLVRLEDDRYLFLCTVHHIISDGWSAEVLMQEIVRLYTAFQQGLENPLPPLQIQYKDFAAWQNQQLSGSSLQSHQSYWKSLFADGIPVLELPTEFPRPELKTFHGNRIIGKLETSVHQKLRKACAHQQSSLFMALFATVGAFLHRYTGQQAIVIGTPNTLRNHPELENQVGLYLNMLALKAEINPEDSLETLLAKTQTHILEAFAHQEYPFDRLVDDLRLTRDLSRSPLFDVMVVSQDFNLFDNDSGTNLDVPGRISEAMVATPVVMPLTTTKYDLTFNFTETADGIVVVLEYNTDLFSEFRITQLLNHYLQLVQVIVTHPKTAIGTLEYISEEEKTRLLVDNNATQAPYPADQTLVQLFEHQVETTPDAVAVRFEDISLSYRQLNELSNQLAHYLIDTHQIQTGDRIALHMHRSERLMVALLGILKAGAAYLPLDPTYPEERIRYMLADSAAKCLIGESLDVQDFVPVSCPVISMEDWAAIRSCSSTNPSTRSSVTDLVYVLYTSGSTGKPKGVMMEYQGVVNRLDWMWKHYAFTAADVILQKTPFVFDVSVWELFMPLCYGASLVMCPQEVVYDPAQLRHYIADYQVTTLHFVPSMLQLFLQQTPESDNLHSPLASVRHIFASGEALLPQTVQQHYAQLGVSLHNLYGPTEAAVDVSYYPTQPIDRRIPIGKPISNVELHVLDVAGQLVPEGVWGEIAIGGVCLARGYLNQPELTAEKFVQQSINQTPARRLYWTGDIGRWLSDGQIEYKGRKDTQVKLRGQRIELSEIENCLLGHLQVESAAVAIQLDARQEQVLVGYVVSKESVDPLALRQYLSAYVPAYMIPAYFVFLDKLPLTVSGKLDRKALSLPQETDTENRADYVPPSNELESLLATIVQEVLGKQTVSITDNFFTIGGDSIKAIQIASRINQLGYKVTTKDIFMHPTVEDLARVAKKATRLADQKPVTGPVPLTPIQAEFFAQSPTDAHHFNQSVMLASKEPLNRDIIQAVFDQLLIHHDALRMTYCQENGKFIQRNADTDQTLVVRDYDFRNQPNARLLLEQQAAQLQAGLDLENGLLAQVALFHLDDGDRLLMIFHHLVIDGVSWRILFEDLQTLYQAHTQGAAALLPLKTDSYQTWATQLTEYASSLALLEEIPYWHARTAADVPPLKRDSEVAQSFLSEEKIQGFELTPEETRQLLTQVNQTYKTEINDLLLTGLSVAVPQVFDVPQVWVDMEGHGREEIIPELDISRTVGWFTSLYPVLLPCSRITPLDHQIKVVKEELRQVPHKGIGYGILKYLTPAEHTASLTFTHQAPILFNYLGQIDQDMTSQTLELAGEYAGPTQSPHAKRTHDLVVTAIVVEGKLRVSITYSPTQYREETIQAFANAYQTALWEVIRHCIGLENKELVTPSDLGFKGLTIDQLENFFKEDL